MVLNCVAYKCNNLHQKGKKISFHSFPFKRPATLNLWIKAINREEDWKPSKTSRLCSDHFVPDDYKPIPLGATLKLLKEDAVPSVFVQNPKYVQSGYIKDNQPMPLGSTLELLEEEVFVQDHKYLESDYIKERRSSNRSRSSDSFSNENYETIIVQVEANSKDAAAQTSPIKTVGFQQNNENQILRKKVKALQQKLRRKDVQISKMLDVIKELKNKNKTHLLIRKETNVL